MGLATAKRFVQEGMDHVFITGRRKDVLDAAVAEIGEKATGIPGDVAYCHNQGLSRHECVQRHQGRCSVLCADLD
jgi:NADP-dependent 3-hydroxy acid dehydrogenase YdfG